MAIAFSVHLEDAAGHPIRIVEYCLPQQIRLEGEDDSWPRSFVLGLTAAGSITRIKLAQFFERQGEHEFTFTACMAGNDLRLSGDAAEGSYTLRVLIQDVTLEREELSVTLKNDESPMVHAIVLADPRTIRQVGAIPSAIRKVLKASTLEGKPALEWLSSPAVRTSRRACLQNILAKLSCTPSLKNALLPLLKNIFVAAPDRIYAKVDPALHARLRKLVDDDVWSHEGVPESPCHQRLIEDVGARGFISDCSKYRLDSFRQKTAPSVQIVVAIPSNPGLGYFADIDIDLGNPFMDVRGLVVHALEVASEAVTDHLEMWKRLADDPEVRPFLAYEVVSA